MTPARRRDLAAGAMAGASAVLAAAGVACVVWGAHRGFDVTDEGFYALETIHPTEPAQTQFGRIQHLLMGDAPTLLGLRLVRLVIVLAAAAVLVLGVRAWLARHAPADAAATRRRTAAVAALAVAGALLSWSQYPQAVSYNSLVNACLLVVCGLVAWGTRWTGPPGWPAVRAFLAGSACAVCALLKIPAGAALFAAVLAATAFSGERGAKGLVASLGAEMAGVAAGFALCFVAVVPFRDFVAGLRAGAELAAGGHHGARKLLGRFASDLFASGLGTLVEYAPLFVLVAAVFVARRRSRDDAPPSERLPALVTALALVLFAGCVAAQGHWISGTPIPSFAIHPHVAALGALVLLIAAAPRDAAPPGDGASAAAGPRPWVLFAFLACAPFLVVLGTDNPPSRHVLQSAAPLLVLAGLLALSTDVKWRTWLTLPAVTLTLTGLASVQFVQGYVFDPYGAVGPTLFDESAHVAGCPPLDGIRLHPDAARLVTRMRAAIRAASPAEEQPAVIGLFDVPGLVYAAGARSPGLHWYSRHRADEDARAIAKLAPEVRDRAVLLVTRNQQARVDAVIAAAGLQFPQGYSLAETIDSPYHRGGIEVWVPKTR